MSLATTAAVIGIGSSLYSLSQSGGGGGGAAPSASSGATFPTTGALSTISPQALAAYQALLGQDTSGIVSAGNAAGGQYYDLAQMARTYHNFMNQQASTSTRGQNTLMNSGDATFAAGQDPQQALYQRILQQTQDQSRAATSARGIGMSPESAGIENRAVGDFNLNWNNQQLARMLQGLQGQTSAYNAAGNQGMLTGANIQASAGYGAQVPQYTQQSQQIPYAAQQFAYSQPLNASNAYTTALNTAFNPQLANYNQAQQQFGYNQQAAGVNAGLTGLNQLATQANTPGSWLNGAFGGSGTGTGGYGYGNYAQAPGQYDLSNVQYG